ncbi:MAG: primosomal protein N', partial [Candidatus Eisenbacteria bacterium]
PGGAILLLVPEIATSLRLIRLLRERCGWRMALFHSKLKLSERKRIWEECRSGIYGVVVGTRSAVFLPVPNLRLIVVEDEHAEPFKQEETPRYNGRQVALMRGALSRIPVVLASSTPSLESYLASRRGEYRVIGESPPEGDAPAPSSSPRVTIVDMRKREELIPSDEEFSSELVSALSDTLKSGKRALLFLNRRGFSSFIRCRDCGFVETCPSCELPFTFHSEQKALLCHRCGHRAPAPGSCRKCGGVQFRFGGVGIERMQSGLKRLFPDARVARVDLDSVRATKDAAPGPDLPREIALREDALSAAERFVPGEVDIFIGTSMVMKGLDLNSVALVGALHAESQLNLPDFRSGERAFQLLSELLSLVRDTDGSTGPGRRLLIQTLNPEHHSVQAFVRGEPDFFYEKELAQREELGYPPFTTMIAFHVSGKREDRVLEVSGSLGAFAASVEEKSRGAVEVQGPSPGFPPKVRGDFCWRMNLRGSARADVVAAARNVIMHLGGRHEISGVKVSVDVDPVGG